MKIIFKKEPDTSEFDEEILYSSIDKIKNENELKAFLKGDSQKVFKDFSERDRAFVACDNLANFYVKKHGEKINKKNSISLGTESYALITKAFFCFLVCTTYHIYCFNKKFFQELKKKKYVLNTFKESAIKRPKNQTEAINLIYNNSFFAEWLWSYVLEKMNYPNIKIKRKNISSQGVPQEDKQREAKIKRSLFIFSGIYGFTIYQNIFLSMFLNIKWIFDFLSGKRKQRKELIITESIDKIFFDEKFLSILENLTNLLLPVSFDSSFKENLESAKKHIFIPGRVIFSKVPIGNDELSFHLAVARSEKEKIAFVQHGSEYCTKKNAVGHAYEYSGDYFFEWGRHERDRDKVCDVVNISSPPLSRIQNRHSFENKNIIFPEIKRFDSNDGITCEEPCEYFIYLRKKFEFLDKISPDVRKNITYRPWVFSGGLDPKMILQRYPEIGVMESGFLENMFRCELVVLDCYATPFYEAMASNTPVIMYRGRRQFQLTAQAQKVFEKFKKVGILLEGPEEAANRVNELYPNVEAWWKSKEVQAVRNEFCDLYCGLNKNWFFEWTKKLWSL